MAANLILKQEADAVIGARFEVGHEIGSGFLEDVCRECLEVEAADRRIPAIAKPDPALHDKATQLGKGRQPDCVRHGQAVAEPKAPSALVEEDRAQAINHLHASGFEPGRLVNFGCHREPGWRRLVKSARQRPGPKPPRLQS